VKSLSTDHPGVVAQSQSHWPACPPPVRIPLTQLGEHPCPYLPDRSARDRAFLADALPPELYHDLMDRGFRRSGKVVYQPTCRGCRACQPVRVRAEDFRLSKSLRRTRNRNLDLTIAVGPLEPTDEKFDLYKRYQTIRHRDRGHLDWQSFVDFLYDSPVETLEFTYRDPTGRLLAVGICDLCSRSLSSVYCYYDPDASRRGLGTYAVLRELDYCRKLGLAWYYLGFWVEGCAAMAYKTGFHPHQVLGTDGHWRDRLATVEAPAPPGS
jgi:arginine-tRNA-protein transferase